MSHFGPSLVQLGSQNWFKTHLNLLQIASKSGSKSNCHPQAASKLATLKNTVAIWANMAASWRPNPLPNEGKSSQELMLKKKLFFTLFLYLPNLPKTSQNPSQNRTKIDVFCNLFLSFFRSYFASIFCWFFVDFKSLETLKIVLPCRREHYFYKIDVFASSPKIDPKTIEIWVQKSMKIWTSPLPT